MIMAEPQFLTPAEAMTVASVAAFLKAEWSGDDGERPVRRVAALANATGDCLTFLDNPKYASQLAGTKAAACLVAARQRDLVPAGVAAIVVPHPHAAFVAVSRRLYPQALRPQSLFGATGISPGAMIHPTARLEAGVVVDPGVVIGPGAEIGSGTIVAAGAVVGPGVRIGRDCAIGPHVSLVHALLGNRVIVHAGVRVGQDGFGFELGRMKHAKVPQIGRVIILDVV
jgi:UDP-3-O-[3-hydroxymyristoyl] glucosamine N-acyltransferase